MRHRVAHRKLGRITPHRIALLRNLATALFDKERIRTTLPKAKELRPFAEKLITLAKREEGRLHARRQVSRDVQDPVVAKKLFDSLASRFAARPGGYTRILRLGVRKGDGAEMAVIELLGSEFQPGKKAAAAKEAEKADKDKKSAAPATEAGAKGAKGAKKAAGKKKAEATE
ncbi:MAG: 50S ribosomal protein L17 [Actinomycetota bacterium]